MSLEPGSTEESFLTVAEVAELLKLNQQTVRNWIEQGSLPALRVGRRVRIRRSDLDRLLEARYTGAPGGAASDAPGTAREQPQPKGPSEARPITQKQRQSAEDFWGGEPIGTAEPANGRRTDR
jgi:excisionase family DNA binding protein